MFVRSCALAPKMLSEDSATTSNYLNLIGLVFAIFGAEAQLLTQ